MRVVRHSNPTSFKQAAFPYLLQDEAIHNLLIGTVSRFEAIGFPEDAYFAHVENAEGEVVAVAMRTPPHGAVLSAIADEVAIPFLAQDYAVLYDTLPTVLGSADATKEFAFLWERRSGQPYELDMEQGIYRLDTVIPVTNVSGEYCPATSNERDLLIDWCLAFNTEALDEGASRDDVAAVVDRKLTNQVIDAFRIWWDGGKPVSMVASNRSTPNGISIGPVYTPKEFRGKGYASAATAAFSQELLDNGKKFCFLYTDMSNPTSNKIYQNIGYEFVVLQHMYKFGEPA